MPITLLDIALVIIVILSAGMALIRGFVREVLAIACWILAIYGALMFGHVLNPLLAPQFVSASLGQYVSMAIMFLVLLVGFTIVAVKVSDLIVQSRIGALDRSLGFVLGALRGLVLVSVFYLFVVHFWTAENMPGWVAEAKSQSLLHATGTAVVALFPPDASQQFVEWLQSLVSGSRET